MLLVVIAFLLVTIQLESSLIQFLLVTITIRELSNSVVTSKNYIYNGPFFTAMADHGAAQ